MCRLKHSPLSFSLTHTHSHVHCVRSWRNSAVPLFMCKGEKHKWLFYSLTFSSSSFDLHPFQRPHALSLRSLCFPVSLSLHFWVWFTSLHFHLASCESQLKAIIHRMNQCTSFTIFFLFFFVAALSASVSHGAPSSQLALLVTSVEASSY